MKIHQFRYVLFLLALILVGPTSLVYSQDASEQSNDKPSPVEQPSKTPNPLESQVNSLEKQITELKHELSALQDLLDNPFQTYAMIFRAIIVLTIVVMFFLGVREIRQLQNEFENSERGWQNRLNEINQRWEGQLKHIRRQGRDNIQKIEEIVSNHSQLHDEQKYLQNTLSKLGNRLDGLELTLENLDLDKGPDKVVVEHPQVDDLAQLEEIGQEARARVESLAQVYENGEPIDFVGIENPTPSQNVVLILNWIARRIEEWESDLERSGSTDSDLIQSLGYANQAIKEKLKEIRGPALPLPIPLELDTDITYTEFQDSCDTYVSRFEGMLTGLQLGRKINEEEYDQFIPQFVKDRLFNSVARLIKFDQLPEQLDEYLQLVGYEVVPIEIGKTQADARIHDIQGSRQANVETGTIAEVILPGLQRMDNSEIVQKPVVIRGE